MSDYTAVKAECLKREILFDDEAFPARNESIYYSKAKPDIEWRRPFEITPKPKFESDGATRHDLSQGTLGNCWFLAAAANLAMNPHLLKKVVPLDQNFEEDYAGIFHFYFWRYGTWQEVIIDDRLPTKDGKFLFCFNSSSPDEFWSALLEKAYAKIHGSYEALETGWSHDALVDFTGGIGRFVDMKAQAVNSEKLYDELKFDSDSTTLITATVAPPTREAIETKKSNGLVFGHAYSITKTMETEFSESIVRLIRLRNPWGYGEWKGAWSDKSQEWKQVSDEVKQHHLVAADGEFWMPFDDFLEEFDSIQLCYLTTDADSMEQEKRKWFVTDFHGEWVRGVSAGGSASEDSYWMNPQYYVEVKKENEDDNRKSAMVVSLIQKYTRLRKTVDKTEDTESAIAFDLYKIKNFSENMGELDRDNSLRHIETKEGFKDYEYMRERSYEYRVRPGAYCIVPSIFEPNAEGYFILRIATEKPVKSGELTDATVEVEPAPKSKGRRFDRLYSRFVGQDEVVDANELRQILNTGLKRERDEDFSKETSRSLIQSVTEELRGTLGRRDTKEIWRLVKSYQKTFDEFDRNDSGSLEIKELRPALKSLGFKVSKKVLGVAVRKYCGKKNYLSLDDFVLCVTRIKQALGVINDTTYPNETVDASERTVRFTMDQLIALTL